MTIELFRVSQCGEADSIEREVVRCGHGIHAELIKLAVQDVVERRKPRW